MTFECSSDSEAVTEAGTGVPGAGNLQEGTFPSWRSGAKIREGFPEVVAGRRMVGAGMEGIQVVATAGLWCGEFGN